MSPALYPSRVLAALRSGQVATSTKFNLCDPRAVEIAAMAGIDCAWLDMEHVPNDLRDIENCVRAARMYGCDTVVRVPRGSYSNLVWPLEMNATGIMVPHVFTGEETQRIARQTRFQPIGRRAMDGGNADGGYTAIVPTQYTEHANTERFVIVQIEDFEAIEHLDAIAQVDGIDMLFFGPADFAHSLNAHGQMDDPRVSAAREAVVKAALRHGKFAGTVANLESRQTYIDMGYRFLNIGADVRMLLDGFTHIVQTIRSNPAVVKNAKGIYGAS